MTPLGNPATPHSLVLLWSCPHGDAWPALWGGPSVPGDLCCSHGLLARVWQLRRNGWDSKEQHPWSWNALHHHTITTDCFKFYSQKGLQQFDLGWVPGVQIMYKCVCVQEREMYCRAKLSVHNSFSKKEELVPSLYQNLCYISAAAYSLQQKPNTLPVALPLLTSQNAEFCLLSLLSVFGAAQSSFQSVTYQKGRPVRELYEDF